MRLLHTMIRRLSDNPGSSIKIFAALFLIFYATIVFTAYGKRSQQDYTNFSRFTDPGQYISMLDDLPEDLTKICKIASQQTINHNLLLYFGIPKQEWKDYQKTFLPDIKDLLKSLQKIKPYEIYTGRKTKNRVSASCTKEAYFLASMLRTKNIPVRIRCGFFKNVRANRSCINNFWNKISIGKAHNSNIPAMEREKWLAINNKLTQMQNATDHRMEHWICEYWDKDSDSWRLLDANTDFLKYHSNIQVAAQLPKKYFEFAYEAWQNMRSSKHFEQRRYTEEFQDGRSHIRSQLLWDFYNLLNHDLAGLDQPSTKTYDFIKNRKYQKLCKLELIELDGLAELLSRAPNKKHLKEFYRKSKTMQIKDAELDVYSFVCCR
jgi:hypothetical protein